MATMRCVLVSPALSIPLTLITSFHSMISRVFPRRRSSNSSASRRTPSHSGGSSHDLAPGRCSRRTSAPHQPGIPAAERTRRSSRVTTGRASDVPGATIRRASWRASHGLSRSAGWTATRFPGSPAGTRSAGGTGHVRNRNGRAFAKKQTSLLKRHFQGRAGNSFLTLLLTVMPCQKPLLPE